MIFRDNFPTIFGITLKVFVRFTLKELRCGLSSSFSTISDPEEGSILFLQVAAMFEMRVKENIAYQNVFTRRGKKTIEQLNNKKN